MVVVPHRPAEPDGRAAPRGAAPRARTECASRLHGSIAGRVSAAGVAIWFRPQLVSRAERPCRAGARTGVGVSGRCRHGQQRAFVAERLLAALRAPTTHVLLEREGDACKVPAGVRALDKHDIAGGYSCEQMTRGVGSCLLDSRKSYPRGPRSFVQRLSRNQDGRFFSATNKHPPTNGVIHRGSEGWVYRAVVAASRTVRPGKREIFRPHQNCVFTSSSRPSGRNP